MKRYLFATVFPFLGLSSLTFSIDNPQENSVKITPTAVEEIKESPRSKKTKQSKTTSSAQTQDATDSSKKKASKKKEVIEDKVTITIPVAPGTVPVLEEKSLKDLYDEINKTIDTTQTCCMLCTSETATLANDISTLIADIDRAKGEIETITTPKKMASPYRIAETSEHKNMEASKQTIAVEKLRNDVRNYGNASSKEKQHLKKQLKKDMKSVRSELTHQKLNLEHKNKTIKK